ncbi:3753_t:CDS:2 [Paraglomus brasilianum]|uniref:3753_t:CDS:1 n=1 Tax=Paraglomus brasilianum TaxID=144538 RepID=A0A9N8WSK3_9GLOM|nr:3753_t:CDS:2 [Paraglomus brasilianum]
MKSVLEFPLPKTWKDMSLLSESASTITIRDFLWAEDNKVGSFKKMTTRIIHAPPEARNELKPK